MNLQMRLETDWTFFLTKEFSIDKGRVALSPMGLNVMAWEHT